MGLIQCLPYSRGHIGILMRRIVANISYLPSTMNFRREFLELRSFLCIQRNEIAIAAQEMEIVAYSSKMTRRFHIVVRYYTAHVRKNVRKGSTFPNPEVSELFIFDSRLLAQAIAPQGKVRPCFHLTGSFFVIFIDRCLPRGLFSPRKSNS